MAAPIGQQLVIHRQTWNLRCHGNQAGNSKSYGKLDPAERAKLGPICALCHSVFENGYRIQFLACGHHGFHKRCVKDFGISNCPLDGSAHPISIPKISLFGETLNFSGFSQKLSALIYEHGDAIAVRADRIAKLIPPGSMQEVWFTNCILPMAQALLQDLIHVFEGGPNLENLLAHPKASELWKEFLSEVTEDSEFVKWMTDLDLDLNPQNRLSLEELREYYFMLTVLFVLYFPELSMDGVEVIVKRLFRYLLKFRIETMPALDKFFSKIQVRVSMNHIRLIRSLSADGIPSDDQIKGYLETLSPEHHKMLMKYCSQVPAHDRQGAEKLTSRITRLGTAEDVSCFRRIWSRIFYAS